MGWKFFNPLGGVKEQGGVLLPAAVCFRAWLSATTLVGHGAIIPFDTEEEDTHGWFTTGAGAKFTPQIAGIYRFSWRALDASLLTDRYYFYTTLRKNGSTTAEREAPVGAQNNASGGANASSGGSDLWRANGSTDFFQVAAYNATGGAINIAGSGGPGFTYFAAELVGT